MSKKISVLALLGLLLIALSVVCGQPGTTDTTATTATSSTTTSTSSSSTTDATTTSTTASSTTDTTASSTTATTATTSSTATSTSSSSTSASTGSPTGAPSTTSGTPLSTTGLGTGSGTTQSYGICSAFTWCEACLSNSECSWCENSASPSQSLCLPAGLDWCEKYLDGSFVIDKNNCSTCTAAPKTNPNSGCAIPAGQQIQTAKRASCLYWNAPYSDNPTSTGFFNPASTHNGGSTSTAGTPQGATTTRLCSFSYTCLQAVYSMECTQYCAACDTNNSLSLTATDLCPDACNYIKQNCSYEIASGCLFPKCGDAPNCLPLIEARLGPLPEATFIPSQTDTGALGSSSSSTNNATTTSSAVASPAILCFMALILCILLF